MTKSIQIFHYENIPTIGEMGNKMKNTNITLKRDVAEMYKINLNNLTELKTKIHNLKHLENGILGEINLQVIEWDKIRKVFADYWNGYYFYIYPESKLLILGGSERHVTVARNEFVEFFNDSLEDVSEFVINKDQMLSLVKKIKNQGPIIDKKKINMMKKAKCHFEDVNANHKAKESGIRMFELKNPDCVSNHPDFTSDYEKCKTFSCTMRVFKVNGILNQRVAKGKTLYINEKAQFSSATINPLFIHWIIFVKSTVKNYLVDLSI